MKILVVDDEPMALRGSTNEIKKVFPDEDIYSFDNAEDVLTFIEENKNEVEYAFLDINLCGITGIELGKRILDISSSTKIVFCTAYSEYACEAYQMYALGYILKPVTAEQISNTLERMDKEWKSLRNNDGIKIRIQTFGNFEVFYDEKPISFERDKSKELLAYLVDRRGAAVTTPEIAGVLWENEPYDIKLKNKTTSVISSLKKSLTVINSEKLLIKTWNHLAIDTKMVKCDIYDFIKGDVPALNSYNGEYMSNYSWAEFTNAELNRHINS